MKNIVICCDGTGGRYESDAKNTNVVRLYQSLGKDGSRQISYYDPGVGTQSALRTGVGRWAQNALASVFGYKVKRNVLEAYRYLMDNYEPGDRVFLFGYSRGAHTVRVLANMLHKCGLLTKGSVNLIPDMARTYNAEGNDKSSLPGSRPLSPGSANLTSSACGTPWPRWAGSGGAGSIGTPG